MTTYMLVRLAAMSEGDQRTYANADEQFGTCVFSGIQDVCKIVPTTGPTAPTDPFRTEISTVLAIATTAINTLSLAVDPDTGTPVTVTQAEVTRAALGRPNMNITDPSSLEEAEEDHPTLNDLL